MRKTIGERIAFLMVKPDGVKRKLIGKILLRIEKTDLELIDAKLMRASPRLATRHYKQKRNGSSGLTTLQAVEYLCSGMVFVSVWKGPNAVRILRNIVGNKTDPFKCKQGTIRRDFAKDSINIANKELRAVRNVIHSSNNYTSAKAETLIWFGKNWRKDHV